MPLSGSSSRKKVTIHLSVLFGQLEHGGTVLVGAAEGEIELRYEKVA